MKKVIVTGSAGFIGHHLSLTLLRDGYKVMGIDGLTDYYDVNLKKARNYILSKFKNFTFQNFLLEDSKKLNDTVKTFKPDIVVHLAAQPVVFDK